MENGLLAREKNWQPDAAQARAAAQLDALLEELARGAAKRGLWLYGPPGRGKSRLLELFMAAVTGAKRRVHFHAFIEELHRRLHELPIGGDPLERLARELAAEAPVLGFDEFYLTNIADAMLLGRLMKLLLARGVIVVATSNWAMAELFQGGLNRDRFMPFLRLMEQHLAPVDLSGGPDWRRQGGDKAGPRGAWVALGQAAELAALFEYYAGAEGGAEVAGWRVGEGLKRQGEKAAWLSFGQACGTPRSRHDYMALLRRYETLVLEGIPVLGPHDADATIRLVTLVDLVYEGGQRLIVSAAAGPTELCVVGEGRPSWPAAELFARTASRLVELTGGKVANSYRSMV